jgi:DNA-directed RNA polymerase specialized sigma24 family protein
MRRLANLRDVNGAAWLSQAELAAANRLRADWAQSEIGALRGSDWMAAPMGSTLRGPGNAQEAAMARRCDARRRVADALTQLAPPLRRVVERIVLYEHGLEALERAEGWPVRSGKLALKLGLAQLAAVL